MIEAAEERERLADGEFFREPCFLQRDANPLSDFGVVGRPLPPEDLDFAGGGREQSLDDLDRRGFARAVGSQQSKAFPLLDEQIQPANRLDRRFAVVTLDETLDANGWRHM